MYISQYTTFKLPITFCFILITTNFHKLTFSKFILIDFSKLNLHLNEVNIVDKIMPQACKQPSTKHATPNKRQHNIKPYEIGNSQKKKKNTNI